MVIASEGEKSSKPLKIESIFTPFVPTGPVTAASRSSALEDTEYLAKLTLEYRRSRCSYHRAGRPKRLKKTTGHAIDSVAGVQQLICFLKFGKIVELGDAAHHVGRCIPAFLTLPKNLWDSKLLLLNGTASTVFKGTGDEILGLLAELHVWPIPYLDTFRLRAEKILKGANSVYYFKIRLKDTTLRDYPASTATSILAKHKHLFEELYNPIEMYPIEPVGGADSGLFLLNSCGVGLYQSKKFEKLSFSAFRVCFATLWKDISKAKHVFLHGDALPHNMVYNEDNRKIMMIDIYEGTLGTKAHKRVIEDSDHLLYAYLRYPNFLRVWRNRQLYTDLQLTVSFLLLAEKFVETLKEEKDKESMRSLRKLAEAANFFLKHVNNKDPSRAYGSIIDQSVYQLVESKVRFLEKK